MADAPAKPPAKKKGGALSGKFHGIPVPAIAVGGGVGLLLVYRWYKARKGTNTNTPTATANPAATGAGQALGGFTGGGQGSGGGAGGANAGAGAGAPPGIAPDKLDSNGNVIQPTNTAPTYTNAAGQTQSTPFTTADTGSGGTPTGSGAAASPPPASGGSVATTVQQIGSTPTAGTFNLPGGVLNFQPSAAVRQGNQVAYGIPNQGIAAKAESLKGVVESGKQLEAKGWTNLTPGALYLVR